MPMSEPDPELPECLTIETGDAPDAAVIWLHGLGADGHDFEPIVPELAFPSAPAMRFLFPHAPVRPVTVNGGMRMRAWYDILNFDAGGRQDEAGVRESAASLNALIARERERGIAAERIVLAGFSQGGAVALHTALRYREPLAGLMALSTYLPLASRLADEIGDEASSQPRSLPIFMAHGQFDPVLPIDLGRESRRTLESAGFNVEWRDYPMAHAVCPDEIADIRSWLARVFP